MCICTLSATHHQTFLYYIFTKHRSVPDNQRAFALGTQFVILRGISFLPGPLILGAVIDSNCISWNFDQCGKKTNCLDYDVDAMSSTFVWLGFITSGESHFCTYFLRIKLVNISSTLIDAL